MSTIAIDIGFIAVVFISLLIGAYRGFVRSLLSVISWVVAVWVTWKFAGLTIPLFDGLNMGPTVQLIVAHLAVFFGVLLVVAIISALLAKVLVVEGIAGLDKILGVAFGAVRGVLIVLLIAVIGSFTFYSPRAMVARIDSVDFSRTLCIYGSGIFVDLSFARSRFRENFRY